MLYPDQCPCSSAYFDGFNHSAISNTMRKNTWDGYKHFCHCDYNYSTCISIYTQSTFTVEKGVVLPHWQAYYCQPSDSWVFWFMDVCMRKLHSHLGGYVFASVSVLLWSRSLCTDYCTVQICIKCSLYCLGGGLHSPSASLVLQIQYNSSDCMMLCNITM